MLFGGVAAHANGGLNGRADICVCLPASSTLKTDEDNQNITPVGSTWSNFTSMEFPGR